MSAYNDTQTRLNRVAPQLRPAGVSGDYSQPTARDLTTSYNPACCTTPDNIAKHSHRGAPVGESRRHWGVAGDATAAERAALAPPPTAAGADAGVEACLRPGLYAVKVDALVSEQREKQYASQRQRPLGRTPEPGYPVTTPFRGFGKPTEKGESTASTMAAMREVQPTHEPGVQVDRRYDWAAAGVDPSQRRFGCQTNQSAGVRAALSTDKETALVPKIVKDYRSTVEHEVGKPLPRGFDDPADWQGTRRPLATKASSANGFQEEQPSVREVLSGWATGTSTGGSATHADDGDGGASPGGPGGSSGRDRTAMTGTVTRRGDTVATLTKMEDEATAQQLVHPCHYVSLGVESRYFAGGRSYDDIRNLAAKCGFGLSDAQVREVFDRAAVDGQCGAEQFKNTATAMGYL